MFGMGGQKQKTSQSQSSQRDPWDVSIPGLTTLSDKITGLLNSGGGGVTADQSAAFDKLKTTAEGGHPYAPSIDALTKDIFGTQSQSGTVNNEFADFKTRMTPVADGANLDIMNDPILAKMLQQVGDDAASRVNASFAAGGRTGSGANQTSVARGVTQAQTPILVNQLNAEKARTDAAMRDLFQGGTAAATTVQSLDNNAQDQRIKGIETGQAALDAENWGPNAILNLEQQQKDIPIDWLSKIAAIMTSLGQMGGQETGTGSSTSKGSNWGISGKLFG